MGMLKGQYTGTNSATLIPSVEPIAPSAYVPWKAKNYTPGSRLPVYDICKMRQYRKILKREVKYPIS